MAENLYLTESGAYNLEALLAWQGLDEAGREPWRLRALEIMRAHVCATPCVDPDDPDPGASFPVVAAGEVVAFPPVGRVGRWAA